MALFSILLQCTSPCPLAFKNMKTMTLIMQLMMTNMTLKRKPEEFPQVGHSQPRKYIDCASLISKKKNRKGEKCIEINSGSRIAVYNDLSCLARRGDRTAASRPAFSARRLGSG